MVVYGQLLVGSYGSDHSWVRGPGSSHLCWTGENTLIQTQHLANILQIIGGFCALIGVFILALPVPIVVNR